MQTFLPFADYELSARALDNKRLGKQRPECKQIYRALTVPGYGWRNHPAVVMWQDNRWALLDYAKVICTEFIRRNFNDSLLVEFEQLQALEENTGSPFWLGKEYLHRSHRSNLLRKDLAYYRAKGWTDPDDLPYYWPIV